MGRFRTLDDVDVGGKRALVRVDFNVPVADGTVTDDTRIRAAARTIGDLLDRDASVLLLAHFGRPKGMAVAELSLSPVVPVLEEVIGRPVRFVATDWQDDAARECATRAQPGEILLFENTRFHPGEEANDPEFASRLAALGDIFVTDAFSAAHRAHASTEGIAHHLPAVAGRTMEAELDALEKALAHPAKPAMAIVGGAKISTKIDLLGNLSARVDQLVIGGAMANTFLAAEGHDVGGSLHEADLLDTARRMADQARSGGCEIVLPRDVVVARKFEPGAEHRVCGLDEIARDEMILDIGPDTVADLCGRLDDMRTVVWNGPFGAFELPPFDAGTNAIATHIAELTRVGRLLSVAGGGDTVAALAGAGVGEDLSFVSTAGGAFLEWLEGRTLPGVTVLRKTSGQ